MKRSELYCCFIPFAGFIVLVAIITELTAVSQFSQLQSYKAGKCMITAKQLLQVEVQEKQSNGITKTTTWYRPDFQFTVQTVNGRSYSAQGYDVLMSHYVPGDAQAILDQYTVGRTYPCWYNPAHPTHAVLTHQFGWYAFLIPGLFFFLGGMLVIVAVVLLKHRSKRST